jgi:metal-responsive CopG/Arc/MetJ family transcriptional regulator
MTEKTSVGVRLPKEYLDEIDQISKVTGRSRSQIMVEAVEVYLGKTPSEDVVSDLEFVKERVGLLEDIVEFLADTPLNQLEQEAKKRRVKSNT